MFKLKIGSNLVVCSFYYRSLDLSHVHTKMYVHTL